MSQRVPIFVAAMLLVAGVPHAGAASIELVSRSASNDTGTAFSAPVAGSADGRWFTVDTFASNLVPDLIDTNGQTDVFVHDRVTGSKTLVSRTPGTPLTTGNGFSFTRAMSADGRWVAFESQATNLVTGVSDASNTTDAFLFDRVTGTVTLVSRAGGGSSTANAPSYPVALSSDGRWLLFRSTATDVLAGVTDVNGNLMDAFLYDRQSGTTTLVSRQLGSPLTTPNAPTEPIAISSDGAWVLFYSQATNLVAGVTDNNATAADVFLFERSTQTTTLLSRALGSATATANAQSFPAAISATGDWVLFGSDATNIVAGVTDGNGSLTDAYLYERATDSTTLVSRAAGSTTVTANGASFPSALSADGRWILFGTLATNLIPGLIDNNGATSRDVYLFDRVTASTTLVTHAFDSTTTTANNTTSSAVLSADGSSVLLGSVASNLVAGVTDAFPDDVFLYDRASGTNTLVSRALGSPTASANSQSLPRTISADGRWASFQSDASNVLAGVTDTNTQTDAFVFDADDEDTALLSRAAATTTANAESEPLRASDDGRWVVFNSSASNLVGGASDANASTDAFVFDRQTRSTRLVSRAATDASATGNQVSQAVATSADGRWILLQTAATDLVAGVTDVNDSADTYVFDRDNAAMLLVSRALGSATSTANSFGAASALSADGRWVLYRSGASNVAPVDGNGGVDAFVFDRDTATTTVVSHAAGSATTTANGQNSSGTAINADGRWIALESDATNLVTGVTDANGVRDAFLFDRTTGVSILVSRAAGSPTTTPTGGFSGPRFISADGRWVLFESEATNVLAGTSDTNGAYDVFLFDRDTGTTTLVSRALGSPAATANGASVPAGVSNDGRWVVFSSVASNVVAGVSDGNGSNDAFLFDRTTGSSTLLSRALGSPTTTANGDSVALALDADGRRAVFHSSAPNVLAGTSDTNGAYDVFLFERIRGTTTLLSAASGSPATTANGDSFGSVSISPDGRTMLLTSIATNLLTDIVDGNATYDAFVLTIPLDEVFANGFE